MRYISRNDVHMRIVGTIVKYKEAYFYILGFKGDDTLAIEGKNLETGKLHTIDPNSEDLCLESPQLGWANSFIFGDKMSSIYVCRPTYRKQMQGICSKNLLGCFPQNEKDLISSGTVVLPTGYLQSPAFLEMLKGYQRVYSGCYIEALETKGSATITRDFCLWYFNKKVFLFRRTQMIGEARQEGVTLFPNYQNTLNMSFLFKGGIPCL